MKVLAILLVVLLVLMLVLSFCWPRGSRTAQERIKDATDWVTRRSKPRAGATGDRAAAMTEKGARATQETAHAGRQAHDEVFGSDEGTNQDEQLERRYGNGAERGKENSS